MEKQLDCPYPTCYQLYCCDRSGNFYTEASVIEKAFTGITAPEYVSFDHRGRIRTGFLKKDENQINENDIEFVLTQIGQHLSVPMAEVVRAYEDSLHTKPHSIISISVAQKNCERFVSFADMQSELFEDLQAGEIVITPWIEKWIQIQKRRENNPSDVWDVSAESMEDCEACFHYPFEIAQLWTNKYRLELICFDEDILKMVMFDILVGQTDRTSGNYGLLIDWEQCTARLAPLFDNATLRKPNVNEWLNGFNHLLIDRKYFAVAAYQRWPDAFLDSATDILSSEHEIFQILDALGGLLTKDRLQFLKQRIRQSLTILNRVVRNHEKIESLLAIFRMDEICLHEEIRRIFNSYGVQKMDIMRLGEIDWEPKYRVSTTDGDYFVKFSLYDRFSEEMLSLLKTVHQHIPAVLIPLITQNIPSINRQINIYPWIKGISLKDCIRTKTHYECYQLGIRCGVLLRDIHGIEVTRIQNTCHMEQHLSEYLEVVSNRNDLLTQRNTYLPQIQKWKKLLNRPHIPALVHLDFVPKNIMIHDNELMVIDWDSCAVADPWMEFYDKGMALTPEKQAWNAGIIDGYFQKTVPAEFWKYFKALSVYALLQATVWAINHNDTAHVHLMEKIVCDSYDNFERDIPKWYEQNAIIGSREIQTGEE